MNTIQLAVGLENIFVGILLIVLSIPLVNRRVGPNRLYGFRIPKAFESEELWYDINAYGARQMKAWAIPMIVAGVVCFFLPFSASSPILTLSCTLGPLILFAGMPIVRTLMYARNK